MMHSSIRLAVLLACLTGSAAQSCYADDSSRGVVLPALHSSPIGSVASTRARVVISRHRVSVSMSLDHAQGEIVLRTPRFSWLGEGEPYPDRQFPELDFQLDGHKAEVVSESFAYIGATDITPLVHQLKLDPFIITQSPPLFSPSTSPALKTLVADKAVSQDENGFVAQWTADRTIHIRVPSGSKVFSLAYTPRPAFALFSMANLSKPEFLADFCLTPAALRQALRSLQSKSGYAAYTYVIGTSLDGNATESLTVDSQFNKESGHEASVVAFCGSDNKPVIDATAPQSAKANSSGTVRILVIEPTGP